MKRTGAQLLSLAVLTVRSALRLRLFLCLLIVLLAILFGLPTLVRGDGSALSHARILLSYTLWCASFVLGAGVLWASCAAVAVEIEGRQLRMTAVTPVPRWAIWLGKWLGVMALAAVLLAVCGAAVAAQLYRLERGLEAPERAAVRDEIRTVSRRLLPRAETIEDEVARRARTVVEERGLPEGVDEGDVRDAVRREILARRATVAPDETRIWVFDLPRRVSAADGGAFLQYRMASSRGGAGRVVGTWLVGEARGAQGAVSVPVMHTGLQRRRVPLPETTPMPPEGGALTAAFVNAEAGLSLTAVFHGGDALELRLPCGAFGPNLFRALLVVFFLLGALAALGLTMSTLFSFPVATFSAFGVALMVALSQLTVLTARHADGLGHSHGETLSAAADLLAHAGEGLAALAVAASRPVGGLDPLGRVADGVRVEGADVARAFVTLGLALPLLLGAAGTWRLKRRELAAS